MSVKPQKAGIVVEKFNAANPVNVACPEQPGGGSPGSLTSPHQRPVKTMSDREYERSMEERYGIREEGIF